MNRTEPFKVLTVLNLPFNDDPPKYPGDTITVAELEAAQQTDEDIQRLITTGAIGEADDHINAAHIVPDPGMPNIESVVAQSQALVKQLEEAGEEVPSDLRAVAELDYKHVMTGDEGASNDTSA